MAHFAQLDENNTVLQVIVVADEDTKDGDYESEAVGIAFCKILTQDSSSKWKESFKDGSQRGRPAGIGYEYDSTRNAYIPPQPYPSWTLDETTYNWEAPITLPTLTDEQIAARSYYEWDEVAHMADNTTGWTLITLGA